MRQHIQQGNHIWGKSKQFSWTYTDNHFKCLACGVRVASSNLISIQERREADSEKIRYCAGSYKRDIPVFIRIIKCGENRGVYRPLKPGTVHQVLSYNRLRKWGPAYIYTGIGLWVMGNGYPALILHNEYTIMSMLRTKRPKAMQRTKKTIKLTRTTKTVRRTK